MGKFFLVLAIVLSSQKLLSQAVAINTTGATPNTSSILDVSSSSKGVLIPRMTTAEITPGIANPATGLLVYNSTTNEFWVNRGTPGAPNWQSLNYSSSVGWALTGNAGTLGSHFIGTTDNTPLQFRVNNFQAGRIDHINFTTTFGYQISAVGLRNSGFGAMALQVNTGNDNTAMGYRALFGNTTGQANTGVGNYALHNGTTGWLNTAVGYNAIGSVNSGWANTGIGYQAMSSNTMGKANVAIGSLALYSNQQGPYNIAIGDSSLMNFTGNSEPNTAIGSKSMMNTTTGIRNTSVGNQTLYSNLTGNFNAAVGSYVLYANTTGEYNTAMGVTSLYSNQTGNDNSAYGSYSLSNSNGSKNTAIGYAAMQGMNTGDYNVAVGENALTSNTSGYANVSVGARSGWIHTNGYNNTFVGYGAALNQAGSSNNTHIGVSAGWTNNGNNATTLGAQAGPSIAGLTNFVGIGFNVTPNASNQIMIGAPGITSIGGPVNWSVISDGRFKMDMRNDVPGLEFIMQIQPVTYNYDLTSYIEFTGESVKQNEESRQQLRNREQIRYTGFIAQDVEAAANKLGFKFSGIDAPDNPKDPYAIRYAEFVVPLTKAVQEQQNQIEQLKEENKILKAELEAIKKKIGL